MTLRVLKWLANLLLVVTTVGFAALETAHADAANPRLLVLYPQINAAYESIFQEVVAGVASHPDVAFYTTTSVNATTSVEDVQKTIDDDKIDAVIAVGKQTYNFAQQLKQVHIIHGGLVLTPNGHSGVSLTGSPEEFFNHLSTYAPDVERVYTVYNEENTGWMIELAKKEAAKHNIKLIAYQADDIREAVKQFRKVFEQTKDPRDAIWLTLDSVIPDKTIMPMALDVAWRRRVVLFSNNPSHTRRGALFSLYPDHTRMGRSLANLAVRKVVAGDLSPLLVPLDNLKISLNIRTASHLGFEYSESDAQKLDIIYPVK